MTEMIENPVVASSIQETEIPSSLHAEKDRETTLSRYEDVDKVDHYVRSIPDTLLMFSEDMGIWLVGYGMSILQIVSSIMVIITESNNYSANPSVANVVTSFATSVAVAARINSSSLELFINMDCLKLVRKERPKDKLLERKNGIITLYLFGQLLLILATSVSISQPAESSWHHYQWRRSIALTKTGLRDFSVPKDTGKSFPQYEGKAARSNEKSQALIPESLLWLFHSYLCWHHTEHDMFGLTQDL